MKKYYLRFKFLILILLMPLLGCYVFNKKVNIRHHIVYIIRTFLFDGKTLLIIKLLISVITPKVLGLSPEIETSLQIAVLPGIL